MKFVNMGKLYYPIWGISVYDVSVGYYLLSLLFYNALVSGMALYIMKHYIIKLTMAFFFSSWEERRLVLMENLAHRSHCLFSLKDDKAI